MQSYILVSVALSMFTATAFAFPTSADTSTTAATMKNPLAGQLSRREEDADWGLRRQHVAGFFAIKEKEDADAATEKEDRNDGKDHSFAGLPRCARAINLEGGAESTAKRSSRNLILSQIEPFCNSLSDSKHFAWARTEKKGFAYSAPFPVFDFKNDKAKPKAPTVNPGEGDKSLRPEIEFLIATQDESAVRPDSTFCVQKFTEIVDVCGTQYLDVVAGFVMSGNAKNKDMAIYSLGIQGDYERANE